MPRKSIGYIYFVQVAGAGPIKIGFSARHPDFRLGDLQIACPFTLERLAYIFRDQAYERFLHERFEHLAMRGEWFRPGEDLMRLVDRVGTIWKPLGPDSPDLTPTYHAYEVYKAEKRRIRAIEKQRNALARYGVAFRAAREMSDKSKRRDALLLAELNYLRSRTRAFALMNGFAYSP